MITPFLTPEVLRGHSRNPRDLLFRHFFKPSVDPFFWHGDRVL
jgi:hypothetical protein